MRVFLVCTKRVRENSEMGTAFSALTGGAKKTHQRESDFLLSAYGHYVRPFATALAAEAPASINSIAEERASNTKQRS
jgi:hypothetical protein